MHDSFQFNQDYDQMTREQLLVEIKRKDQYIISFTDQQNSQNNVQIYRKKLEEQLEENQRAVSTLGEINIFVQKLATKIRGNKSVNTSFKSQLSGEKFKMQHNISSSQEDDDEDQLQLEGDCLQNIITQTFDSLALLDSSVEKLISSTNSNSICLTDLKEKRQLQDQINESKHEINILKQLLMSVERDFKTFINRINQQASDDLLEELNKMNKEGLIMLNKQLMFQLNQVEKSKKTLVIKNLQEKKTNTVKYQKILQAIKLQKGFTIEA